MAFRNTAASASVRMSGGSTAVSNRLIGLADVKRATGLSRSTIYDWMEAGHFPRQRKLGPRRVAWLASDIEDWIAQRPAA